MLLDICKMIDVVLVARVCHLSNNCLLKLCFEDVHVLVDHVWLAQPKQKGKSGLPLSTTSLKGLSKSSFPSPNQ